MNTIPNSRRSGPTESHFSGLLMAHPADRARVDLPPARLGPVHPATLARPTGRCTDLRGPRQRGRGRGDLAVIPRGGSDLRLPVAQKAQPGRARPAMTTVAAACAR